MNLPAIIAALPPRLALILGSLRAALAGGIGRDPSRVALLLLAWPYLHRLEKRFTALVARVASGRTVVPAHRPDPVVKGAAVPGARRLRKDLPHGFGWMIRLTPAALPLASQVRHLLADPALAALLAAAPQSGRILRPLCRMLGIAPGADLPAALHTVPPRPPASAATAIAASLPPPEMPPSDVPPPGEPMTAAQGADAAAPCARASPWRPMPA